MDKRVFYILNQVRAEDELKEKTSRYLHAEIQKRKNGRRVYKRAFAIACILALFFLGGWNWNKMYFTASAYIDIDVNPSIELTLNRFGKVIHASAYNDDGAAILEGVSLRHTDYDDAVAILLDAINMSGYFEQDSLLSITVQTNGRVEENSILEGLQATIDEAGITHQFNAVANIFAVTEEVKHCASEYHVSPAKYLAIEGLLQVDSTVGFEDYKKLSISELQQLAQERCFEHDNTDDSYEHGNDSHGNDFHENEFHEDDFHEDDLHENDFHENDFHEDDFHEDDFHENDLHEDDFHEEDNSPCEGNNSLCGNDSSSCEGNSISNDQNNMNHRYGNESHEHGGASHRHGQNN